MALNNWLTNIQDWLLPRLCPACGLKADARQALCARCQESLPVLHHACGQCAAPFERAVPAKTVCGRCLKHPPAFARSVALYRYLPPADHLIRLLKFHQGLGQARSLGWALALRVDRESLPDLIVPIPLHRTRLRERGYNQALEIARPVARRLELPLVPSLLARLRSTPPQAGLDRRARQRNMKNAFEVTNPDKVRGQHIALVDDVMTSGSTAEAAARVLLRAGAKSVVVWVVARA